MKTQCRSHPGTDLRALPLELVDIGDRDCVVHGSVRHPMDELTGSGPKVSSDWGGNAFRFDTPRLPGFGVAFVSPG